MAARRRRRRRRRRRKPKSLIKKVNLMMKRIKPETQYLDDNFTQTVSSSPFVQDAMSPMDQAVTDGARIAGKIYLKFINMNCSLTWNTSSTQLFSTIRITIVRFDDPDLPGYGNIFQGGTTMVDHWNTNQASRYHVVYDRYHMVGKQGNAQAIKYFKIRIKVNREVIFASNSDTRANNFRYALLEQGDETSNFPSLVIHRRMVFNG